jgi:4-hydroxy-tetrahydrodipicolinate reductase
MNKQSQYDEILVHESHHSGKLDSPSGTAITLANQIIHEIKRLKQWVNYKTDENKIFEKEIDGELPVFSTREDDIPGTHIIKYRTMTSWKLFIKRLTGMGSHPVLYQPLNGSWEKKAFSE